MTSTRKNRRNLMLSSPSSSSTILPLFIPPLPPLPPIDRNPLPDLVKQDTPACAGWGNEAWCSNKFNVNQSVVNTMHKVDIESMLIAPSNNLSHASDTDNNLSSSTIASVTEQKYDHQDPYFPYPDVHKLRVIDETEKRFESTAKCIGNDKRDVSDKMGKMRFKDTCSLLLTQSPPPRKVTQPGRTMWSITPDELSELARDMAETKKEPAEANKTVSYYSKSSKCRLIESTLSRVAQTKVVAPEQPIRTFKKYYGLPNIPTFTSLHRQNFQVPEQKTTPFKKFTETENKPQNMLDYRQVFGLSAMTPTFYPRQSTDTNELMQMVGKYS
ncbi:unnamed protein product [Peronospora belbahrii]|uniref:Fork-head domain-containing protein n=1 Tax=Peronospora belbahrii TaxID=622444 RepID=A0ABN8CZF5_9STRA|nr:unnamed protein product [Peronospora belbahrii]